MFGIEITELQSVYGAIKINFRIAEKKVGRNSLFYVKYVFLRAYC